VHVIGWVDQTLNGWDVHTPSGGNSPPMIMPHELNGLPGIYFGWLPGDPTASNFGLAHYAGPFYEGDPPLIVPADTPYPFSESEAHILYVVCRPGGGSQPASLGVAGGMLVTERDTFTRMLWTLGPVDQWIARSGGPTILHVNPAVDYTSKPLLILYRWTGSDMFVSINGGPDLATRAQDESPSSSFPPVPDDAANHRIEIGGASMSEAGFQGTIEAVLLAIEKTPSQRTVDYLTSKWGPFPPVAAGP
jgi:hypothetical protein